MPKAGISRVTVRARVAPTSATNRKYSRKATALHSTAKRIVIAPTCRLGTA